MFNDRKVNELLVTGFLVAAVLSLTGVVFADLLGTNSVGAQSSVLAKKTENKCTTIQSGELLTSTGDVITTGFDEWGYNYQANMFNGKYCDAYRDAAWCQDYKDDNLMMKWNDLWLSNQDCNGDQLLDRHYGFASYLGSGAWLTNHMSGEYEQDGEQCSWTYFVKIVAAPADATEKDGVWYSADGTEIGPVIWGEFATIQEISNDPCNGDHGVGYLSPEGPGLGKW